MSVLPPTTHLPLDEAGRLDPSTPPPPSPRPPRAGTSGSDLARPWRTVLVAAVVAALVGAGSALGIVYLVGDPSPSAAAATDGSAEPTPDDAAADVTQPTSAGADGEALTPTQIAERVSPAVASVEVTVGAGGPTGTGGTATGSAVIVTSDGALVTNAHVVAGAAELRVTLADGTSHPATVVGTDPTSDLAVLDIDADGLPAARLAERLPEVGDTAVAIGSPFGLDGSVTVGVVSALERTLVGDGTTLTGLLQTDAAINPGNSGGALVDDLGRIVGINTAIYSRSGANDGVGFAVPATTVATVVTQLLEGGEVSWPVLGVTGQDVDPSLAEAYGLGTDRGALVAGVEPGSGAAEGGLQPGDIVVRLGAEPVGSISDLVTAVRAHAVGDTVDVTVLRDGEQRTIEVTLGTSSR